MVRYMRFNAWQGLQGNISKSMVLAFFQVFLVIVPILVPFFFRTMDSPWKRSF